MKSILWIILGCLFLITASKAAGFDCSKAQTKVEKLICADAELSKMDEGMAKLYSQILKASSNDPALKNAQRDWLKYRQICLAADYKQKEGTCLSFLYRTHLNILRGSLPTEPDAGKDVYELCTNIAALVEKGEALKFEPSDYENNPSRGNDYKHLDIDGDGKADIVTTGCGTGECLLEVKLSSGGEFDLDESPFYLIRYQSRIYALVSYSEDDESKDDAIRYKYHLGRLYLIAPPKAKLMCGMQPK